MLDDARSNVLSYADAPARSGIVHEATTDGLAIQFPRDSSAVVGLLLTVFGELVLALPLWFFYRYAAMEIAIFAGAIGIVVIPLMLVNLARGRRRIVLSAEQL